MEAATAPAATTTTVAPTPATHRTTYREVLAQPQFRLLFSTRVLGISAETLRITTLSVLIFRASHSPLLSALAFGVGFLPQLPGSMLLGALADRLRPRPLLTVGFLLQCAAAAVLGLLRMPTAAALGVVAAVAVLTPVFGGATSRLASDLLTGDAYVLGRSLMNMASSGAQLVALAVGGAVIAALGTGQALVVAAVLNACCAAAIWLRLSDLPAPGSPPGAVLSASWSGAGRLMRDRTVRRLSLAQWLPCGFVAGAESLVVSYAGQRGFSVGTYGLLMACGPTGMLLGDLVVGRLLRPSVREALVVPLVVVMGLPLLGLAADPSAAVCALLLLASSTGFSYAIGLQRPFLEALPAGSQGQAFGLLSSGLMTLQGLGPVLVGAVASLAGTGRAMAVAGGATVLTAGWMAGWRRSSSRPSRPSRTLRRGW
ncbi:putative MFS family arabinose efflux permease [Catenulispora sp. GAS73]|uniref:MFS transporter n=1 Tax=Catenulispora sp. GAS73 TaxID=3156269 RepID=UPI0035142CDB